MFYHIKIDLVVPCQFGHDFVGIKRLRNFKPEKKMEMKTIVIGPYEYFSQGLFFNGVLLYEEKHSKCGRMFVSHDI